MRSRSAFLLAALVAASLLVGPASPAAQPDSIALVQKGLAQAVAAGRLDQSTASGYAAIAKKAVTESALIPPLRSQTLLQNLADVAVQWRAYDAPWSLTLFSMLAFNEQELASKPLPPSGTDRTGEDGILYRFVTGHGFEFHPLGAFGALNSLILAGQNDQAQQLAEALVARGLQKNASLVWAYPFPFGKGTAPWTSGMAQAVAAQALARVGQAVSSQDLLNAAQQAYAAIPGKLDRSLPQGPWIKLYSFDGAPVLNAQLQTIVSLQDYAQITNDTNAAGLAAQLQSTAEALLPQFDTGYWSLYSLKGEESPLSYHDYVVTLLRRLANRTQDTTWSDYADKFHSYEEQPPVLNLSAASMPNASAPVVIYPDPQDGYLDNTTYTFWLSKLSTVTLHAGPGHTARFAMSHGTRSITWWPGRRAPGTYYPYLTVVDPAGNTAKVSLRQVQIEPVRPPVVQAHVTGKRTLVWTGDDAGTPWLHLVVKLVGTKVRYRDLGRLGLSGRAVIPVPPGTWQATLVAGNSARQAVVVQLGPVTGR